MIVIDVGINCGVDGKLKGDVVFVVVVEWVDFIIFVLGGVGLMMVVMLM